MMRSLLIAFFAVAVSLPGLAGAQTGVVERHGQLRVEGNRIVDRAGKPVTLRGMSLFWSQWMPQYYNADAVRWLRDDWKVDIVRAAIAVRSGGYMTDPAAETKRAEAVIDAAIANGIYVLVDWHAHEPDQAAAIRFFTHVAKKYGRHPNLIYETWNEPLPKHDWSKTIRPYHEAVIARIRAADPDALVIAGTQSWSQDVDKAAADPVRLPNVAYTLHFYAGTHKQPLRDKATAAMKAGAALFVTEWGTTAASGDEFIDAEETARWLAFCEANGLSHLNWSIADKDEKSAALKPGAAARGGWTEAMLTESGRMVRAALRDKAAD